MSRWTKPTVRIPGGLGGQDLLPGRADAAGCGPIPPASFTVAWRSTGEPDWAGGAEGHADRVPDAFSAGSRPAAPALVA